MNCMRFWFIKTLKTRNCIHDYKKVHDTKYDNIGFREHYPIVYECQKCRKIIKV